MGFSLIMHQWTDASVELIEVRSAAIKLSIAMARKSKRLKINKKDEEHEQGTEKQRKNKVTKKLKNIQPKKVKCSKCPKLFSK